MKRTVLLVMSLFMSLTVLAAEQTPAQKMTDEAIMLVKLTVGKKDATYSMKGITNQGGSTTVTVGYEYQTKESGVSCTKEVNFSKDAEGLTTIKIVDGLCFS